MSPEGRSGEGFPSAQTSLEQPTRSQPRLRSAGPPALEERERAGPRALLQDAAGWGGTGWS